MRSRLLAALILAASPCAVRAADTPRETYRLDLTCASAAAAAKVEARSAAKPGDRAKADDLAGKMLETARASGAGAGVSLAQVGRDVDRGRERLLGGLRQPDRSKADKDRTELGRVLISCAMLHAAKT